MSAPRPAKGLLATCVASLALVVACGGGGPSSAVSGSPSVSGAASTAASASTQKSLKTVNVLTDITLSGVHAPLFAGKAQGFFAQQGIDLQIHAGSGSADSAAKVGAGAADFAIADTAAALQTLNKGAKLTLVGAVEQKNPGGLCTIESRHKITSFADLKGLSIGASPGDAYLVPLPYMMEKAGATATYKSVSMTPADRIPALLSGKVDAVACGHHGLPSYQAAAKKQGLTLDEFAYADHGFDALGWAIITRTDLVKGDPQLVQGFVTALVKSYDYSVKDPSAAVADFVKANPEQDQARALEEWKDEIPLLKDDSGKMFGSGRFDATIAFVNDAYKTHLSVKDVYTSTFIGKALAGS